MRSCTALLVALALAFIAVPQAVAGGCRPGQFCSTCPRVDNAGHPLQDEPSDAHYVHCQYQDTDCFYGPKSSSSGLAFGYPAGACPGTLGPSICSDAIPPPPRQLIGTDCPPFNQAFIYAPLRSQPSNPSYIQCHYSSSECYYDLATRSLVSAISVSSEACPPLAAINHLQFVV